MNPTTPIFTIVLIAITAIISFQAFSKTDIMAKLCMYPYTVQRQNEWYRFITHGFVHADTNHLIFNMISLYFFGRNWELVYTGFLGLPGFSYILFYLLCMIIASVPSYWNNRNNPRYSSLGASGAVSGIIFSMILISPWSLIYVFFVPIPAIIYAVLYVAYSIYMDRQQRDNVNHSAHLWGALAGIVISIILRPEVAKVFVNQLLQPSFG